VKETVEGGSWDSTSRVPNQCGRSSVRDPAGFVIAERVDVPAFLVDGCLFECLSPVPTQFGCALLAWTFLGRPVNLWGVTEEDKSRARRVVHVVQEFVVRVPRKYLRH
jgi:hypothetical protein